MTKITTEATMLSRNSHHPGCFCFSGHVPQRGDGRVSVLPPEFQSHGAGGDRHHRDDHGGASGHVGLCEGGEPAAHQPLLHRGVSQLWRQHALTDLSASHDTGTVPSALPRLSLNLNLILPCLCPVKNVCPVKNKFEVHQTFSIADSFSPNVNFMYNRMFFCKCCTNVPFV